MLTVLLALDRLDPPVASCTKGTATLLRANMLLRASLWHSTADRHSQGQATQGPDSPQYRGEFVTKLNQCNMPWGI